MYGSRLCIDEEYEVLCVLEGMNLSIVHESVQKPDLKRQAIWEKNSQQYNLYL